MIDGNEMVLRGEEGCGDACGVYGLMREMMKREKYNNCVLIDNF
jgi:hypothetical protein